MQKFIWFFILGLLALLTLRAPSPITLSLLLATTGLAWFSGVFTGKIKDPHTRVRKQAKKITEIAYQVSMKIPKDKISLIDNILYIDNLFRKKKIAKAEATFYKHILPKLAALQEKQIAINEIPGAEGLRAAESFSPKMDDAYTAVEGWCDHRIKAYTKRLELNTDIDKDVIISLTKHL